LEDIDRHKVKSVTGFNKSLKLHKERFSQRKLNFSEFVYS
jgi:hypothetical protein